MENYDSKSCNTLEKVFYRPIEAALRWCNLIAYEAQILEKVGVELLPATDAFPDWPCLRLNTEKIVSAIQDGDLQCGRDGKTVQPGETVRKDRITIKHTDLKIWMREKYPDQTPKFLFDEVERNTHSSISKDSLFALQVERDGLKARLDKAEEWAKAIKQEMRTLRAERDALQVMVDGQTTPSKRAETTDRNIIGAMLELLKTPRPGRDSNSAIIRELVDNYGDKPGISKATLENRFADAVKSINAT